jgi:mannose-6-phosphate isomerase
MGSRPEALYQLKCSCNSYPWGKQGSKSLTARLCEQQQGWLDSPKSSFKIDESKPYAEMWMGTYPVLPSYIADTGEDLQDVLDRHPEELIGDRVMKKFGHTKLPYLPKVLSIAKALPLQLHPDKEMAAKLHAEKPDAFTDANHKPEIALALGEFEAFCGFKPLDQIAQLMELEPLKRYMPANDQAAGREFTDGTLKHVVKSMLQSDDDVVKETYNFLVHVEPARYKEMNAEYIPTLAPRLAQQYDESDPGILVALITMNYLVLQAGDSIYIPADGIHAYLSGDIIECMARSNNVLNTGFCPRAERSNIDLFTKCLTFKPHSAEESMLRPQAYSKGRQGHTQLYAPPMSEFSMLQTKLKSNEREELGAVDGPSILIATKGSAKMDAGGTSVDLTEGQVWFIAHGVEIELVAGDDGLLMHTAFVE